MFLSSVIATIGRPTLARSVESILSQEIAPPDFEVIVVNDSGRSLPPADWQRSDQVTILHTPRRERCVARNAGAAIARGAYLHFLDDDDWMLPGAWQALWPVARNAPAALVYGASRLVDSNGMLVTEHHIGADGNAFVQVMAGEWIPLPSAIVEARSFFRAGGFDPRLTVCQDLDLFRKVALGSNLASTPTAVVACTRDRHQSTTDSSRVMAYSTWSRDNVLGGQHAFARMRASATNPYWRGRWVRAYLTCVAWNLHLGKTLPAFSRGAAAIAAFLLCGAHVASPAFWRALTRPISRPRIC